MSQVRALSILWRGGPRLSFVGAVLLVCGLLWLAPFVVPVSAAAGFVQLLYTPTAASTNTLATALTTTAGHGIVVTWYTSNSCTSDGTITLGGGNTDSLTLAVSQSDADGCTRQYYSCSIVGGLSTYTLNWTNNSTGGVFAAEISGQATTSCLDQTAVEAGSTSTAHNITATGTLAQAAEIAVAVWNLDGSGSSGSATETSGAGFTIPVGAGAGTTTSGSQIGANCGGVSCGAVAGRGALAYLVTAATTALSPTLTSSNAIANGIIGTYKAAATATAAPHLLLLGIAE